MLFRDRTDAGDRLAEEILGMELSCPILLCIPRGGVVVGERLALRTGAPLDIIVPRKIGAPANPEVAVGAVAQDGSTFFDERSIALLGIDEATLADLVRREVVEIKRRMARYRGSPKYPDLRDNTVVLVDDGAATGYTMLASARFARGFLKPAGLVIAVPVAPPDTLDLFFKEADQVVCLHSADDFYAVGQFYQNFNQISDGEVVEIMKNRLPVRGYKTEIDSSGQQKSD